MVEYEDDEYILNPTVYVYDCFGRRMMKKVYNPAAYVPANIRYVSGGNTRSASMWQTLEEWDMDEDEVYVSYVYGNYIDEVLSMRKDIDGAGETHEVEEYYFHADDLFNVVLVTDEAGDAVERYEYGDYGAPFYYDESGDSIAYSILNNTRLFNGREWDQETRFYYYRTRYLDPTMGRFTTRDTIGVWGDEWNNGNALAFVGNGALSFLDPFGLKTVPPAQPGVVPVRPGVPVRGPARVRPGYYPTPAQRFERWRMTHPNGPYAPITILPPEPGEPTHPLVLPPAAQPQPQLVPWAPDRAPWQRRNKNQTCTNNQLDAAEAWKDFQCKDVAKCKGSMSCSELAAKMQAFQRCAQARMDVILQCYSEGDSGHITQVLDLTNGSLNCLSLWYKKKCHIVDCAIGPPR